MKPLMERVKDEVLVCDGAMGTQLIEKGLPLGECPELWAIKRHKVLFAIHNSYIKAGADMITTNTFGANRIKLKKFKIDKKLAQINSDAVKIAKAAAADKAYVLGNIGPTGEYLEPAGSLKFDECYDVFLEQAKILEAEGADAIIIETMTDIEELKAAVIAIKENVKKIPLIACMSFSKTKQGAYRTTSGATIPQMVDEVLMTGVDVIGANCGVDIEQMTEVIARMRPLTTAFIIAEPNAGNPKLVNNKTVYAQSADEFSKHIPALINAGANVIGGCCGTTPEHIRKIKEALKR
ncbi:MAG: homocysteine S-methyltransferase family protein [Candidatus Omnitrophica bacterium]|nr:homocysteine S-methyltransferase family protein [Candidatus Omnitrophota bacterium]